MSPEKRNAEMMRAQEAADANSALVEDFKIVAATRMSVPLFAHSPATGMACARLTLPFLVKPASIDKRLSGSPAILILVTTAELGAAQARKGS